MPIYYRAPNAQNDTSWSPWRMRLLTTLPLVLYPLGCVLNLVIENKPGPNPEEFVGLALIVVSMLCFIVVASSYLQRLVGEETKRLDEFEIDLRRRAYTFAYQAMSGVLLLFIIYLGLASDGGTSGRGWLIHLWTPTTFDHWNAIMWGAILWFATLPSAYLAWTLAPLADND